MNDHQLGIVIILKNKTRLIDRLNFFIINMVKKIKLKVLGLDGEPLKFPVVQNNRTYPIIWFNISKENSYIDLNEGVFIFHK